MNCLILNLFIYLAIASSVQLLKSFINQAQSAVIQRWLCNWITLKENYFNMLIFKLFTLRLNKNSSKLIEPLLSLSKLLYNWVISSLVKLIL